MALRLADFVERCRGALLMIEDLYVLEENGFFAPYLAYDGFGSAGSFSGVSGVSSGAVTGASCSELTAGG